MILLRSRICLHIIQFNKCTEIRGFSTRPFVLNESSKIILLPSRNRRRPSSNSTGGVKTKQTKLKKKEQEVTSRGLVGSEGYGFLLEDTDVDYHLGEAAKERGEGIAASINELRPMGSKISKKDYEILNKRLSATYTKDNLEDSLKQFFRVKGLKRRGGISLLTKKALIKALIHEVWNLEVIKPVSKSKVDKTLTTEIFKSVTLSVNDKILFFLLADGGKLLFNYTTNGVKVALDSATRMIATATTSRLKWFEASLTKYMETLTTLKVDLTSITNFLAAGSHSLPIKQIQKITDVYFEKLGGETYKMNAVDQAHLSRAHRLFVWFLDYNTHVKSTFNLGSGKFYQYLDNSTLPWVYRISQWFRIRQPISKDQVIELSKVSEEKSSEIYEILNDFNIENVKGSPKSSWNKSGMTVTLGQLLVDQKTTQSGDLASPNKFLFHTQVPNIRENVLALPLLYEAAEDVIVSDNYSYYAQIKLVPNPYKKVDGGLVSDVSNYKAYPPVEVWMELDKNDVAQWDTMKVLSIESQNDYYLGLDLKAADLKISNGISMTLADAEVSQDQETAEDENTEGKHFSYMDKETVPPFLAKQPDLYRFVKKSKLNFNGKVPVRVSRDVNLNFPNEDGTVETVNYLYLNVTYRRHLDLLLNDDLVQFAVVEGGALGGRRIEVNLVSLEEKQTKETFKKFLDNALNLVDKISVVNKKGTQTNTY